MEIRRRVNDWTLEDLRAKVERAMTEGGGLHPSTVSRWHAQRSAPRAMFRGLVLEVLEAETLDELGLGRTRRAARNFTYMTKGERKREVHRRKWLKGMGAAGATGLLLPVSDLVRGAQLLEGRKRISIDEVTSAQETATRLAIAYRENPGADSVRAAQSHAWTLLDLLRINDKTKDLAAKAGLLAVASDACALAGYADLNAGRLDAADRWFKCALDLAREAGDRRLEALALASRGWVFVSDYGVRPDPAAALAAFRAGAELYPFLPPAGRAWLFGELALESAGSGDDLASGRFLGQAHTAAARLHYQQPGWGWWSTHAKLAGWDGTRPHVYRAIRSLRLGRPAEALEGFDGLKADRPAPDLLAGRHVYVMEACAALEDPDQTCGAAHTALDLAMAYDLGSIPLRVLTVRRGFSKRLAAARSVRELDERLALAS